MLSSFRKFLQPRVRALSSFNAWFLIVLGLFLFTLRTPMPAFELLNLPMAVTVFQVGGLMFMLGGFQIVLSVLIWPTINLVHLLELAEKGNVAAGISVAGLLIFNGLSLVASVTWLSYAVGAQVGR
jgi:hypothetical protein